MTQPAPEPSGVPPAGAQTAVPPDAATETMRILLVEDDPATRKILQKQLGMNGYAVEVAENGARGLSLAGELWPDIIISDWMMPEMDGRTLCSKIKADPDLASIYFIMLTAKDLREDRVTGLDSGADEYLIKPCDLTELLARVRAAQRIITLRQALSKKNEELEAAMRRINHELEVTSAIQRSLLPQKLPAFPDYQFAAWYHPSTECSGDYYDIFELGEGRFSVIMADVSGHGTPAMVAMALARSLVHHLAPKAPSPADLLMQANRLLYDHLPTSQYLTAFYGICEMKTGRITYSSAGQNPPFLLRGRSGESEYLPNCEGFPLKLVTPDAEYQNHEVGLESGEALLLYTDGIPEACNPGGELFGSERLSKAILESGAVSPAELVESIKSRLDAFTEDLPLEDDVSMLAFRRA